MDINAYMMNFVKSGYIVYADRPELTHTLFKRVNRNETKDRFLRIHKETWDWTTHASKYNDAPVLRSGSRKELVQFLTEKESS